MASYRQKDGNPAQFADQRRSYSPASRTGAIRTHGGVRGQIKIEFQAEVLFRAQCGGSCDA